jgi:hypothetical protein
VDIPLTQTNLSLIIKYCCCFLPSPTHRGSSFNHTFNRRLAAHAEVDDYLADTGRSGKSKNHKNDERLSQSPSAAERSNREASRAVSRASRAPSAQKVGAVCFFFLFCFFFVVPS